MEAHPPSRRVVFVNQEVAVSFQQLSFLHLQVLVPETTDTTRTQIF